MRKSSAWAVQGCGLALWLVLGCSTPSGTSDERGDAAAADAAATQTSITTTAEPETGESLSGAGDAAGPLDTTTSNTTAPLTDNGNPGTLDGGLPATATMPPGPVSDGGSSTTAPPAADAGEPAPAACGAAQPFDLGLSPTRELFVDAAAAEAGDGSSARPFATLAAAFAELQPGTAVRIRPGTYAGGAFVSNAQGSATQPIWIGGIAGEEKPVLSGGNNAIQFSPASYLIVHDLEITGQSANGLNVDDGETGSGLSHHLVFRDLLIHSIGDGGNQDCLKLSGVSDHFVLNSAFEGCSGGSAIDHVGCQRGVIADNVFQDLGGNGVQSKGGSDEILITRNQFLEVTERAVNLGGSTGFEFFRPALSTAEPNFEARNVQVLANVFYGGTSPIAFVGCVSCLAANNTLIDPVRWVTRILQETTSADGYEFLPARDGRFVNNLIYYSQALLSTHVNVGPDTAADSFIFAHNLWYAYDAPEQSAPQSLPSSESNGIYAEEPGLLEVNAVPLAIDELSPAFRAGTPVAELGAAINGVCFSEPPSIGAFEVQ